MAANNSSSSNSIPKVEVLRAVFPFLDGKDLALCMCVSKLWQEVAKEDYLWKLVCARRWPSTVQISPSKASPLSSSSASSGSSSPSSSSSSSSSISLSFPSLSPLPIGSCRGYYQLFSSLRRHRSRPSPSPELSFNVLEFYLDIWNNSVPVYSNVIPGPVAMSGIRQPPANVCSSMRDHLINSSSRIAISVSPRFQVSFPRNITVSLIVRRKDRDQVTCLLDRTAFDYMDALSYKAHTSDYLQVSSKYPFVSNIRAWLALLLVDTEANDGHLEVFGVELDFGDVADSYTQMLLLMDMLDWK